MTLQTSSAPRMVQPPRWPTVAVGALGVAAVAALGLAHDAGPVGVALAAGAVAIGAALAFVASAPSPEARYRELIADSPAGDNASPPLLGLINALPDPIIVVTAAERDDLTSRRYLFVNSAARQLLRIERGEGLLVSILRDPTLLDTVDQALFEGRDAECIYETGGTQSLTFRAQARPVGLALDQRRLAVLVFRDETEFRQVERTRADFLANASHELRTPLASLTGFIETLRGHAKDDPAARDKFLAIMQGQAARMSRLIDDLMSLSRIELNEHVAPAEQIDLAASVSDLLDALGPIAQERQAELRTELPPKGAARILGDRDQISQVIQNLVDNALKYSPPGGVVEVSVLPGLSADAAAAAAPLRAGAARLSLLTPDRPGDGFVALRVSDRGPGIAREHLPRLTERFYRVEGQKSGERSGTGLGLAIVKHIVNRHRGGLVVESQPGEGTTFTAYFPMPHAEAAEGRTGAVAKLS